MFRALTGACHHKDSQKPFLQWKAALSKHSASAHAEMLAASFAAIGHWFVVFTLRHINRTAVTANWCVAPPTRFKVQPCSFLIWKLLEELES